MAETNTTTPITEFTDSANRFGYTTIWNAKLYLVDSETGYPTTGVDASNFSQFVNDKGEDIILDSLKTATFTTEGPTTIITGGQSDNPLVKAGKKEKLAMTDALGNMAALEAFGQVERVTDDDGDKTIGYAFPNSFPGPIALEGETYIIDQASGKQKKMFITVWQFLPDAIGTFTQESGGSGSVFDLNGDVLATYIKVTKGEKTEVRTTFRDFTNEGFFGDVTKKVKPNRETYPATETGSGTDSTTTTN